MKISFISNLNIFSVLNLDALIPSNYPDKYIFFVLLFLAFIVTFLFLLFSLKLIINRKKFLKSVILVKLKTSFLISVFLNILLFLLIIFSWYIIDILIFKILISLILFELILYTIFIKRAPSGVTSDGVYVNGKIYAWFNIHDYYIDLSNNNVIFSSNIKGGLTLKGLTPPLNFSNHDTDSLKEVLEKQNTKFLKRIIIR